MPSVGPVLNIVVCVCRHKAEVYAFACICVCVVISLCPVYFSSTGHTAPPGPQHMSIPSQPTPPGRGVSWPVKSRSLLRNYVAPWWSIGQQYTMTLLLLTDLVLLSNSHRFFRRLTYLKIPDRLAQYQQAVCHFLNYRLFTCAVVSIWFYGFLNWLCNTNRLYFVSFRCFLP